MKVYHLLIANNNGTEGYKSKSIISARSTWTEISVRLAHLNVRIQPRGRHTVSRLMNNTHKTRPATDIELGRVAIKTPSDASVSMPARSPGKESKDRTRSSSGMRCHFASHVSETCSNLVTLKTLAVRCR